MDRTGFCRGSLSPCIYFERPDGYVILGVEDVNGGGQSRRVYEERYKALGWEWREARTLAEVDQLQKRLTDQIMQKYRHMADTNGAVRAAAKAATAASLRQRMCSSSTSPYERDFIDLYLKLHEDKRDKYRDSLTHRNMYIDARENDSSRKVDDLMPMQPGDFWRTAEQQK